MIMLYIDPGTGSMLFTIFIGIIGALVFFLRGLILKLKVWVSKDKSVKAGSSHLPIVIYTDHKRYWNVFRPICDEFEKRGRSIYYFTQSSDDPVFESGYKHVIAQFIGEGNKGFAKLNLLNADIVLSTTPGLDVYQWKRSKSVGLYVHILHSSSDANLYRMFGMDYYDAILLSGQFQIDQIRELEKLRNLQPKQLSVVGLTYMDALMERYAEAKIVRSDQTTILLAPSWGENSILCRFGDSIIGALIDTGYRIVIRPHPQSKTSDKAVLERLEKSFPESENLEWNYDNDNFDVLSKSDLMISDFSGVIFDYVFVFDKPMIYTDDSFDVSCYDAAWSKKPLWFKTTLPQIGFPLKEEDIPNIKELIDNAINSVELTEGRQKVRDEAWQNRGKSAETIADFLISHEDCEKSDLA